MKKLQLLLLTLLIPFLGFTQSSWINIQLLTDDYPTETSWQITPPGGYPIIIQNDSEMLPNTLYDTTIALGGQIVASIFDQYGDGLGASQWNGTDGWFLIQNDCQDTIMYVAGNFGDNYIDTLDIAPCAPPTSGCTNPIALNYDSLAYSDDGSCEFVEGCMNPNATNYDPTAGQLPNGKIVGGGSCNLTQWNQNYFGIDSIDYYANPNFFEIGNRLYLGDLGVQWFIDAVVTQPDNCNTPAVLLFVTPTEAQTDGDPFTFAPGTNVNAIVGETWKVDLCEFIYGCTQPNALNFNPDAGVDNGTCINIIGCMDNTAANYNPAATQDDGSCNGGGEYECSPGKVVVTVEIMFDQFAVEIGWDIYTTEGDLIFEAPSGQFENITTGQIVTKYLCIDEGEEIQFTIDDTFGDGLGGAQFGGIDGTWVVYTPCDTISQGIGDFGTTFSEVGTVEVCTIEDVLGCTDPTFIEYNPLANVDAPYLCLNLNVYGCIDSTAFNYDDLATAQLNTPDCDNTLTLTDWADNGWAGSFLVVTQGNNWWGPFTLEADQLIFDTLIPLNTTEEVHTYFYSYGNSQITANQCKFEITNPEGTIISAGGTNAFNSNIMDVYNQSGEYYSEWPNCGDNCIDRIYGCTDPSAVNYNSAANTDDNLCYYNPGCTDAAYEEYHTQGYIADYNDGSCLTYAIFGCMDLDKFNYDEYATVNWTNVTDQTDPCIAKVFGCLDATAFNYDPLANTEDYTCIPFVYGCMDNTQFNYDPLANTDNNTCIPKAFGCTDSTSLNYDILANTDDGSCIDYLYGCTDSTAINYNALANTDDGTCITTIYGCTSPIAFNYNILANVDDGSCTSIIYGCMDVTSFNYNPDANTEDNSCVDILFGCTDPLSFNYDLNANTDNGSCISYIYGCTDPTAFNYDLNANTDNGSCISYIYGCMDSIAFNYNINANTDNGSCIDVVLGCIDNTAFNYNPLANTLDNSCCYIGGCTDPLSINYNENACFDDNSCIIAVPGCTDVSAFNYNPSANVTDSTACLYDAGCIDGPGNPYWLNDGCYAWVIDVDNYCCNNKWDESCQSMYDYCQLGWPTDIADISTLGIAVYPNPTKNILIIDTRLDIKIELYDMIGKLLIGSTEIRRLDLSNFPNGLYNLSILYNNKRYSKQIVKQ